MPGKAHRQGLLRFSPKLVVSVSVIIWVVACVLLGNTSVTGTPWTPSLPKLGRGRSNPAPPPTLSAGGASGSGPQRPPPPSPQVNPKQQQQQQQPKPIHEDVRELIGERQEALERQTRPIVTKRVRDLFASELNGVRWSTRFNSQVRTEIQKLVWKCPDNRAQTGITPDCPGLNTTRAVSQTQTLVGMFGEATIRETINDVEKRTVEALLTLMKDQFKKLAEESTQKRDRGFMRTLFNQFKDAAGLVVNIPKNVRDMTGVDVLCSAPAEIPKKLDPIWDGAFSQMTKELLEQLNGAVNMVVHPRDKEARMRGAPSFSQKAKGIASLTYFPVSFGAHEGVCLRKPDPVAVIPGLAQAIKSLSDQRKTMMFPKAKEQCNAQRRPPSPPPSTHSSPPPNGQPSTQPPSPPPQGPPPPRPPRGRKPTAAV